MSHDHNHHHTHNHIGAEFNADAAFKWGIGLNLLFVFIELIIGFRINSLALLSDAGHNLGDVASLVLVLVSLYLSRISHTRKFTYGFGKSTILVAFINSGILLISAGIIGFQAFQRFYQPVMVPGKPIILTALAGIFINGLTAWLFNRHNKDDLNVRAAYLHLLADALVSFAVVLGGVAIYFTGFSIIDPLLGFAVMITILWSSWRILKDSLRLTLDGVPANVDVKMISTELLDFKEVKNVHHIHVWALSTSENALTAHIIVDKNSSLVEIQQLRAKLKHHLLHLNIQHVTLEIEGDNEDCENINC